MLVATNFGLITLIANGYRALVYAIIGVVVVPLATDVVRKLAAATRSRAGVETGKA